MLITLTFRSFLERTVVERANDYPWYKKRSPTLVKSTQNWLILAKFTEKKSSEIGCFLLNVSWRTFPPSKFPVKSADFSKNLPLKILRKLTFFLLKSREIGRFFCEFLLFSREIGRLFRKFWLFSRENPMKSADFSANLPLKIPWNFAFFPRNIRSPVHRKKASQLTSTHW